MKRAIIALCLLALPLAAWGQQTWTTITIASGVLTLTSHPLTLEQDKGSALTRAEKDENWLAGLPLAIKVDPEGAGTSDSITSISIGDNAQMINLTPATTADTITIVHATGVIENSDGENVIISGRQVATYINRDGVLIQSMGGGGGGSAPTTFDVPLFGAGAAVSPISVFCEQPTAPIQVSTQWIWGITCPDDSNSRLEWQMPSPVNWDPTTQLTIVGRMQSLDSDPSGDFEFDVQISCQGALEGVTFSSVEALTFDMDPAGLAQYEPQYATSNAITPGGGCNNDDIWNIRLTVNPTNTTVGSPLNQILTMLKILYTTN